MSTRQKSFFDQDTKPKHYKGQWNRGNYNGPPPPHHNKADAPPQRCLAAGPPIMPSSQTRTKLKAFQFIEGAPSIESLKRQEQNKENAPVATPVKTVNKVPDSTHAKVSSTPKILQSKSAPPPSTPATRLPLAELVGNEEDSRRYTPRIVVSPEEQLCWRGSQPINTPLPRKSRKRARSSSPIAASQEEALPEPLRNQETPVADPATELWSRYTSNKGTPPMNKAQAFAHLINDVSPRSATTAGSVSGLRRWASCGDEFPKSAAKRRRTKGAFRAGSGLALDAGNVFDAPSSDGAFQGQPETSRIADLLHRMRDSIPKGQSPRSPKAPSSSSPLPDITARHLHPSDSPLQKRHVCEESRDAPLRVTREAIQEDHCALVQSGRSSSSSDDFGDADFDTEMVEALELSQQVAEQPPDGPSVAVAPPEQSDLALSKSENVALPPVLDNDSDDEYGLDDELEFAADLEQVASLYDNTAKSTSVQPETVPNELPGESVVAGRKAPVINLIDDSDDDFGDDIDADEFAAAEIVATQAPSTSQDIRAIQRYLIKRVDEGVYTTERGYQMREKVLLVEEEKTKLFKAITLRHAWYDTPCTPNSYVHLIGQFSRTGQCVVDDHHNMIILHPDHLISATVVADSFGCLRRAVLQDRIKATSKANPPMLYGTLLHELFQAALSENRWDTQFLSDTIDKLLPSKFETILEIAQTCEQVKEHLSSKLPELQSWAEIFVRAEPRVDAVVRERNGRQSIMSINKLLDVEEHVWSPMYGLKGNIDATVQVVMQDDQGQRTLMVPFEVKTGKNSSNAAHVAQTALYNLLLSNRYDVEVAYGILYYLETSDTSRIPTVRNDIMHMIIKRNELACYVRQRIELPPMLKEDFKCQKCYAQEPCFLYNKLVEDGDGELLNAKAKARYDELVTSLKPTDQEFMKKWDTLLTKEESDMMRFRRELWTMLSTEREELGRCFSNVILEPGSCHEEPNGQKINRFSYTFIKQRPKPGFSFTESQLVIGEPVIVSDEKGHFALANGYVTNVRKRRITVAVDRRLHNSRTRLPGFDSKSNQTFAGVMEVFKEGESAPVTVDDEEPVVYRLDKDEFSNGMAAARNNLIQIMDDSVYKARDLRSLIVELRPPTFRPESEIILPPQSSQMAMNSDQKAAVAKVMSAKDYALVLGMPGTGKTTTIAHLIRSLVAKGKSVLLTSYTHTAVDNILLKIRKDSIGILRIGAAAKVHPEVREFATLAAEPKDSLEELEKSWMNPPVVATTCLSINHPLFGRRVFDYCIVDEASQITLPVCLGPIRMAKTFILVGDHHQLPPLVQNKEASEGGLDVSLFKLLCDAHPQAVVNLEHQYRMCAEIMLLSNTFIYSGRLKCGTPSVATRRLTFPRPGGLQTRHHPQRSQLSFNTFNTPLCPSPTSSGCWLTRTLDPSLPVMFINTDPISTTLETQSGPRITNSLEARLVTQLTLSLLSLDIPASEIGIIAFYRSQLALLRQSLSHAYTQTQSSELGNPVMGPAASGVELHTADKFQGRDKEVVLVSCVRSNEAMVVGDLLKDRRRVNVALTRGRSKLVLVGSERTLSSNELLRELVGLCRAKGWVCDLTMEMVESHAFGDGLNGTDATMTQQSVGRRGKGAASPRKVSSPSKKVRKPLGEVSVSDAVNKMPVKLGAGKGKKTPSSSPERISRVKKTPKKVVGAGKKAILDSRPVLRDVYYGAL